MSNIENIRELKNKSLESLIELNGFETTKGLLSNFSDFIDKNKSVVYALAGVSLALSATKTLNVDDLTNMMSNYEISQNFENSNNSGIDFSTALKDFQTEVNVGNSIVNNNYLQHQNASSLNDAEILKMASMKDGETIFFKNPFMNNNVIGLKINNSYGSFLDEKNIGPDFQVTEHNHSMFVNNSEVMINYNNVYQETFMNDFANATKETERLDLIKYVIYHEAAHSVKRQSANLDTSAVSGVEHRTLEMQSDIAALMLIGKEAKDLSRFNYAIDTIISSRISNLDEISDHNTAYGLIELKKVVNENPNMLNMQQEDIAEFSYRFTNEMEKLSFEDNPVVHNVKSNLSFEKDNIVEKLKSGEDVSHINYYFSKLYNKGLNGIDAVEFINKSHPSRIERTMDRVSDHYNKEARHDDVVGLTYLNNKIKHSESPWYVAMHETKKDLEKMVDLNPRINKEFINMINSKIKIDEINYDFSSLNNFKLEKMSKDSVNYINKSKLNNY